MAFETTLCLLVYALNQSISINNKTFFFSLFARAVLVVLRKARSQEKGGKLGHHHSQLRSVMKEWVIKFQSS